MSVVTEHLERRGCAFEVIAHRQVSTSIDEARALGVDADEVLKTLALRTGSRYALLVIPASRRLDLHLARDAVGDSRARLASEEELADAFAGYQLGALPPLAGLVDAEVYVDPEVLRHDSVAFAAGAKTESVRLRPGEMFGGGQVTTVPLVRRQGRGSEDGWSAPGGAARYRRPRARLWVRHLYCLGRLIGWLPFRGLLSEVAVVWPTAVASGPPACQASGRL